MGRETVTKTLVCGLQTSNRKNDVLQTVINNWQTVASHCADVAVGYKPWQLEGHASALYRATQKFEHLDLHSKGRLEAATKVSDAFVSWRKQPNNDNNPKSQFGDGHYCRFTNQEILLEKNKGRFAVKLSMIPYKPEWFNLKYGQHQKEILQECYDNESKLGAYEVHYNNGNPNIHITVTREIEVLEPSEVQTTVGIDLGENFLYALGTAPNRSAYIESGTEFRHHREKLTQRINKAQHNENLRKVHQISGERKKYTDWVTHTASRSIVDQAREHDAPAIILEDLTGYRKAKHAIHDWPFAEIQEKVMYKATEEGIPIVKIDPAYTSQTCNKCGERGHRDQDTFECAECDYEVHADINAAFNIAEKGAEKLK